MDRSYTATVELNGGDAEYEIEATYTVEPAGGDGWTEPRYPATVVDVRVVRIDGQPASAFSPDTVMLLEQALEDGHDGFMLDEWNAAAGPCPDRARDERIDDELMERF